MHYLTAQDLRLAQNCATKLYYKKHDYPITTEMSAYARSLGDGMLILRKIAQLLYPNGHFCHHQADTFQQLESAGTLYNGVFYSNYKLAQVDILRRRATQVEIIQVKNRTFDSKSNSDLAHYKNTNIFRSKRTGEVNSDWRPVIEELAWQKLVLSELFPHWQISTYLLLPDRYKTVGMPQFLRQFRIIDPETVEFLGDPQQLLGQHFLSLVPVDPEVNEVLPALVDLLEHYLPQVIAGFPRQPSPLGKHCRECEFPTGYQECWGSLAGADPHIFDLYQMGRLTINGNSVVSELVKQGKASMYDIPLDELSDPIYSQRQLIQIEYTQKNQEWIDPELGKILNRCSYPLYFIDFETARLPIPWDANLRPNEQIAFQWSCHTLSHPHSPPQHQDWIDVHTPFPNLAFVESLCTHIAPTGEPQGTIFTWGSHELSVLKDIQRQLSIYGYHHLPIARKLEKLIHRSKFVDMDSLTRAHYFHPLMKQKTSLKWVLAAIWKTNQYLHSHPYFSAYLKVENGEILSPYASLPKVIIDGREVAITNGSGAMTAYLEIICGANSDRPEVVEKWLQLLKQYCSLDTLGMVMIWHHWHKSLNLVI